MRTLAGVVLIGILVVGSSVAMAVENQGSAMNSQASVAMHYDQEQVLREYLNQVKPAAGVEEIDEESKRTPYWNQKVFRRKARALTE